MTNAKSRINDFSKGKNIKAYAGGLSSIASKAVEKIGNTASKAKDLAKNNPRIIIAAAILAVAVGSMEPASACNVGLIANNITNQNATPSSAKYIASLTKATAVLCVIATTCAVTFIKDQVKEKKAEKQFKEIMKGTRTWGL